MRGKWRSIETIQVSIGTRNVVWSTGKYPVGDGCVCLGGVWKEEALIQVVDKLVSTFSD